MFFGTAIGLAFAFGLVAFISGLFAVNLDSSDSSGLSGGSGVVSGLLTFLVVWVVDWILLYTKLPPTRFSSFIWVIVLDLVIMIVASLVGSFVAGGPNGALAVSVIGILVFLIIGAVNINGDVTGNASAHKAADLLHVVPEDPSQIPDTDQNHMLIVPREVALAKVNTALSSGQAGQLQLGTYTELKDEDMAVQWIGPPGSGHLYYVVQPQFDGAGNKRRLNNQIPGYFMVDAENPDLPPIEHFGGQYTMKVSINGGQINEDAVRYAYTHGYSDYFLDDPTIEIDDQGNPYITITQLAPQTKWTRPYPVGLVLINAHTGDIKHYGLNEVPSWIDRVYGSDVVKNMVNTWAFYS